MYIGCILCTVLYDRRDTNIFLLNEREMYTDNFI